MMVASPYHPHSNREKNGSPLSDGTTTCDRKETRTMILAVLSSTTTTYETKEQNVSRVGTNACLKQDKVE